MAQAIAKSYRESLGEALRYIVEAQTAPDAAPVLPVLGQLHQVLLGVIRSGVPGAGAGAAPGAPPGQAQPQQPSPGGMPSAPGQGVFPHGTPNPGELQAMLGNRSGL